MNLNQDWSRRWMNDEPIVCQETYTRVVCNIEVLLCSPHSSTYRSFPYQSRALGLFLYSGKMHAKLFTLKHLSV